MGKERKGEKWEWGKLNKIKSIIYLKINIKKKSLSIAENIHIKTLEFWGKDNFVEKKYTLGCCTPHMSSRIPEISSIVPPLTPLLPLL